MRPTHLLSILTLLAIAGCNSARSRHLAMETFRSTPATGVAGTNLKEKKPSAGRNHSPDSSPRKILPASYQESLAGQQSTAPRSDAWPSQESSQTQSELTLDDLEAIALENNPALQEAAARIEAAQGLWLQAGLPPNPVFGYSGQQLGSSGQAEQQGVYVGQQIITGRKLRLNRQNAAWKIQRMENEYEADRLRVLTDVRMSYYNVLIAQYRRELAEELVSISEKGAQAAEALFQAEEASEADPLRARVVADNAKIVLQNAINERRAAWIRLAAVLGTPELPVQQLAGEVKTEDLQLFWDEELQRLLTESPEISAAMADVEAAHWAVQRAIAEVIPDVDVQAVFQDDRSTGSSNANLQVTLPIPLINRNQGGIQKAIAEAAAAERQVDRLALDLQSRLAAAFQRYTSARNQVEQYSKADGIIAKSKRTMELIRIGYKAEEFGILDLLTAQRTYFQTNLAYLDSLSELAAAMMEIRGLMLRNSLAK